MSDATCDGHERHTHALLADEVVQRAARLFSALGEPSRLRVLELLLHGRHCVSELAEETGASLSSVSQRLKLLANADLVRRSREGKHVYYALADDHVRHILLEVFEHVDE